jgi:hypothetical protein
MMQVECAVAWLRGFLGALISCDYSGVFGNMCSPIERVVNLNLPNQKACG